jgi:competence ComEA-like helix-hairpin-helix protein
MSPAVVVAAWLALAGAGPAVEGAAPAVVDLNTADVATLCTLPGIGPKKAVGIVALRERRPLTRVSQLLQVRGIGPRLLERLKGRVTLRPPPSTWLVVDRAQTVGFQQDAQRARGTFIAP